MRLDLPLRRLIPALLLIASMVLPARAALAAPPPDASVTGNLWVDAKAGNDANSGLSAGSALRTIQAAARIAGPGATVHILPGTYRESVVPAFDGSPTARINYVAENGPGSVRVRGSVATSTLTWTRLTSNTIGLPASVNPANIYYVNLSGWGLTQAPRFIVQLNAQGNVASRFMPAREPDIQVKTDWKPSEFWWLANGGSSVATCDPVTNSDHECDLPSRSFTQLTDTTSDSAPAGVQAGNLTTLGSLVGATLVAMDAKHAHYVYHTTITAHDVAAGRITVADNCDNDGTGGLGWGSKYYVENHPALLDQPGEWWYNASNGYLYLWSPNGTNPAQLSMEISRLDNGFDLTNRSYITLNGLTVELFNGDAYRISNSNSKNKAFNDVITNSTLQYASNGVTLYQYMDDQTPSTYAVDGFVLQNSEVAYMDTSAIVSTYWWSGAPSPASFNHSGVRNTVIQGNHLHHLGFNSAERLAVGIRIVFPDKIRFTQNQVDHVAHLGTFFYLSLINSTKQWNFSPQEIKIGNILVADNVFESACMLASDCGALKFGGSQRPRTHVFRDVLVSGNVFRNSQGWSYVSTLRQISQIGDANGFYLDQASGVHVYRNISYNNTGAGFKLSCLWRDGDSIFYNNIAANNYVYGFKLTGTGSCDNHNGSIDTQLVNNILVNNEAMGIRVESSYNTDNFGNLVIDHNLYYANGWDSASGTPAPADIKLFAGTQSSQLFHTLSEIQAGTPWEDHGVEGNPAFASYNVADHNRYDGSWPDFHLTAGSTNAIDRGTTSLPASLSALLQSFGVSDSMNGNAFDIGRYESALSAGSYQVVPGSDFDGDGRTDPAKYDTTNHIVSWLNSSTGNWSSLALGKGDANYVAHSDFDGDGKTDPAKFVPSANSLWYYKSTTSSWEGVYMGPGTYQNVPSSDFDGDGKTDPALFLPSANALWYRKSSTGVWAGVYMGPGTYQVIWGSDFDGDGKTDPALFYSAGGANALWYRKSTTGVWAGLYMGPGSYQIVPASDFDGDGRTDAALYDAASHSLWYLKSSNSTWQGVYMGAGTMIYVAASDFDGDGRTDPAQLTPSTGALWWMNSSTGTWDGIYLGSGF